tara:strand:- start:389 stop:1009 length:621 start_codon:yes stop_codon:yes gene_type:complete
MKLNIVSIFYLFFRFAPFIIVSYFALQSIFNQDLKGVIYLVGLLIAATLTILLGTVLPNTSDNTSGMPIQSPFAKAKCNQLTLGSDGPISKLPLSQTVFGYTLAYLSYFISINNLQAQNIPTFILFPILILADMVWNTANGCSTNILLLCGLISGAIFGILWAMIIESTNAADLSYFSGISNKDVCSRPTKSLYKCRTVGSAKTGK